MTVERAAAELSEFLQYLATEKQDGDRLPSLVDLSRQLKVSTASLREQLEVARTLGVVEVRPKTGIRRLSYRFTPAVLKSLSYAAAIDAPYFFRAFSDLRWHIETSYFHQAVSLLNESDLDKLRALVDQAMDKLRGRPVQIPHSEHKELHLLIYRRLNNPFVTGILEAYWEAYESVGLDVYNDISYLNNVWAYHLRIVEAICRGDTAAAYQLLVEHTNLLSQLLSSRTPRPVSRQFE